MSAGTMRDEPSEEEEREVAALLASAAALNQSEVNYHRYVNSDEPSDEESRNDHHLYTGIDIPEGLMLEEGDEINENEEDFSTQRATDKEASFANYFAAQNESEGNYQDEREREVAALLISTAALNEVWAKYNPMATRFEPVNTQERTPEYLAALAESEALFNQLRGRHHPIFHRREPGNIHLPVYEPEDEPEEWEEIEPNNDWDQVNEEVQDRKPLFATLIKFFFN